MKAQTNMTIACAFSHTATNAMARPPRDTACESSVAGGGAGASRNRRAAARALPLLLALAAGTIAALPDRVAAAERYPVTPGQRETAEKVAAGGVALSDLAANAPESYSVQRGDTLWAIAALYLKSPWRWPELWGMNQTQVHNPHLIYPGQTLILVRNAQGQARLQVAGPGQEAVSAPAVAADTAVAAPAGAEGVAPTAPPSPQALATVKLRPQVRDLGANTAEAIASIPNNLIEPFLARPMVVAAEELDKYPRIVATPEDRLYLGAGDVAYARGITDEAADTYHVFRPARALFDPDDVARRTPVAYEAVYLGTARVTKRGANVTTMTIADSSQEVGVGDRLVPITRQELIRYVPRRSPGEIAGRILSVYNGVASVGAGDIVTLNRGRKDGLEIGTVLAVLRNGRTIVDHTGPHTEDVKLPDENIGQVFVFRLFDGISYALLVSATGPVQVGDRVSQPDAIPVPVTQVGAAPAP